MNRVKELETIYQGEALTLTKNDVIIKNTHFQKDFVRYPNGVAILVLKDDQVLLVKQYRAVIDRYTLEIPAGKAKINEDLYACGLRELEEETGFTSTCLHPLCNIVSTPGFCDESIQLYWTKDILPVSSPLAMDEDEDINLVWMPLKEAYQRILDQKIHDAKTIVAIQAALLQQL